MKNNPPIKQQKRAWGEYVAERMNIKAGAYCARCGALATFKDAVIVKGSALCPNCAAGRSA